MYTHKVNIPYYNVYTSFWYTLYLAGISNEKSGIPRRRWEVTTLKPKLIQILFKNSVRTAKKTQLFTITKINWLMLFKEIIAVCSKNHTKPINTLCGQDVELISVKSGGTYRFHWALKR
jgi:hypothetical protein